MKYSLGFCLIIYCLFLQFPVSAQMDEKEELFKWQRFVHADFELSMPVSKANYRPLNILEKPSLGAELLPSLSIYDLLAYEGSNETFFCTVQLSAIDGDINLEGVITKLRDEIKYNYELIQEMQLVSEEIERIENYKRLKLVYSGNSEVYSIYIYLNHQQLITLMLSDLSDYQEWTKKFLKEFQLRN